MSEGTKTGSEVDFATLKYDLAIIKARLIWLLMPTFLIMVAVFGLSVLTWMEVTVIKSDIKSLESTLQSMKHKVPVGTEIPTPEQTEKTEK